MNLTLKKQIKAYAGFAGTLLSSSQVNAQVVFTDIIPDDTIPNAVPFLCDIDNDGNSDFKFGLCNFLQGGVSSSHSIWDIYCFGENSNNKILSVDIPLYGFNDCFFRNVLPLNIADTIPPLTPPNNFDRAAKLERWVTNFTSFSSFTWFSAAGPLNQDFCIGIEFSINGQNHFGWIKVELLNRQAIIKEYAYQSQPNVPILACDTTNLATGISQNNPQFNFSQQNNSIHISTFQKLNHSNICAYDLLGKEILQQPFEGKETTITIDKKGIYFVEVKSEKGVFRKKVFIY